MESIRLLLVRSHNLNPTLNVDIHELWSLAFRVVLCPFRYWYKSTLALVLYLMIVSSIAAYDVAMTIKYASCLIDMELNPIGRWIMRLDSLPMGATPDVRIFLSLKILGTLVVLYTMYKLYRRKVRIGHPVALGVASFQLYLGYYLTYVLP